MCWRCHHLIGNPIRLLLVIVARLVDGQLGLDRTIARLAQIQGQKENQFEQISLAYSRQVRSWNCSLQLALLGHIQAFIHRP